MKINSTIKPYTTTHAFDSFINLLDEGFRQTKTMPYLSSVKSRDHNYYEDEKKLKFEVVIPGYSKDEINIKLDASLLLLEVRDKNLELEKGEKSNNFTVMRSFRIPHYCDSSKIVAKLNNGILEIILPKKVAPKPKVVKIN